MPGTLAIPTDNNKWCFGTPCAINNYVEACLFHNRAQPAHEQIFSLQAKRPRRRAAARVYKSTRQGESRRTENSRLAAFIRQLRCRGWRQLIPYRQATRARERPHNRALRTLVQRSSSRRGEPNRPQDHGRDETGRRSHSTGDGRRSATHDRVITD